MVLHILKLYREEIFDVKIMLETARNKINPKNIDIRDRAEPVDIQIQIEEYMQGGGNINYLKDVVGSYHLTKKFMSIYIDQYMDLLILAVDENSIYLAKYIIEEFRPISKQLYKSIDNTHNCTSKYIEKVYL